MDKAAAMASFVAVAEENSFTRAARRLGKSQPALARTIANLEAALGVRLLRRTTRSMQLTPEGTKFLVSSRRILADIHEAEAEVRSDAEMPSGHICIAAPVTFGHWHIAPIVAELAERFPQVQTELLLHDRVVDLVDEGVDLALRIGPLVDSTQIATPIGTMRHVVVVSPELLAKTGEPTQPSGLESMPCVLFTGLSSGGVWSFVEDGKQVAIRVQGGFSTNHAIAAVEATLAGLGYGRFLEYQVGKEIAKGNLIEVLNGYQPPPFPVSLVTTESRLLSTRVRLFKEQLREQLAHRRQAFVSNDNPS